MLDHELRKLGIGGSEVGAILGVDGDRDGFAVWADKKGGTERTEPTDRMRVGKALERGVLDLYTHVTGRTVEYCDETSRHPERPWQIYTPDALCPHERRGVDAKVVFWDQRRNWGETEREIPSRVVLQAWWYLSATDYDAWDIAAYVLGEEMPRVYTIVRDLEVERVVLAKCEEFYRRYLVGDEVPPMGATDSAARWLAAKYPRPTSSIREATPAEIELLEQYADVRAEYLDYGNQKEELEVQLKATIGDAEGLEWENGRLTWMFPKDPKQKYRWEGMALALLNAHVKDPEMRAEVLKQHELTKLTRYFRFHYKGKGATE